MTGGGSSGGTVVSQVSPQAAMIAGQYEVQAAQIASQEAQTATDEAIGALNNQFTQASYAVQPYQAEGIQALDQLNQYLGLNPYNPGAAPTAPQNPATAPISSAAIDQYIQQNTSFQQIGGDGNTYSVYSGVGATPSAWAKDLNPTTGALTPAYQDITGVNGSNTTAAVQDNPGQNAAITSYLQQENAANNADTYQSELNQYALNTQNYNNNEALYNQYTAEGPYNSTQVANAISNLPGYQAQLAQGTQAIDASASAQGYLGSGKVLKQLMSFGQNTLSQFYGNELSQLAGLVALGNNSATQQSTQATQQGSALASLYTSLGDTEANASLAAGSAQAQAATLAGTQYNVIGASSSSDLSGVGSVLGSLGSIIGAL